MEPGEPFRGAGFRENVIRGISAEDVLGVKDMCQRISRGLPILIAQFSELLAQPIVLFRQVV